MMTRACGGWDRDVSVVVDASAAEVPGGGEGVSRPINAAVMITLRSCMCVRAQDIETERARARKV